MFTVHRRQFIASLISERNSDFRWTFSIILWHFHITFYISTVQHRNTGPTSIV